MLRNGTWMGIVGRLDSVTKDLDSPPGRLVTKFTITEEGNKTPVTLNFNGEIPQVFVGRNVMYCADRKTSPISDLVTQEIALVTQGSKPESFIYDMSLPNALHSVKISTTEYY